MAEEKREYRHFIHEIIDEHNRSGRFSGQVITRFPPEPNGYLHIGHAKSILLNFGLAREYGGRCHLRFDDTNPAKEEMEYVEAIKQDVAWLGCDWGEHLYFASDYFEQLYEYAQQLICKGLAYVDELSAEEIRQYRGTLKEPGKPSPFRDRPAEESLDLLERMKTGEFPDGSRTLRAKIDMASGNINMRDPVLYRVLSTHHHRTGDQWHIYPMYDFAHGQSDSIEGVTHSICTLEFESHRPLYDWFCDALDIHHPQQIEFARLNLSYTVMSKRKLLKLVQEGYVDGWDDPRMPTLSGMRRRGVTAEAIRRLCARIGVAKRDGVTEIELLEFYLREDLNQRAQRRMAVLNPLKVVITNYPEGQAEELEAINNPEDDADGARMVPFSRELYIESDDFLEDPPKKFFRLGPGREVRLRWAYYITCQEAIKDENGEITELHCTYDPETKGGQSADGRKVKGTLHWVSAPHAVEAEVRLYDRLFSVIDPDDAPEGKDFTANINPESLKILTGCQLEPALAEAKPGDPIQFERMGYFTPDSKYAAEGKLVFNRSVGLRDTWAKVQKNG